MKHFKKLNAKGIAHWVVPALVVVVIGGIGSYLLEGSHADSVSPGVTITNTGKGAQANVTIGVGKHDVKVGDKPNHAIIHALGSSITVSMCGTPSKTYLGKDIYMLRKTDYHVVSLPKSGWGNGYTADVTYHKGTGGWGCGTFSTSSRYTIDVNLCGVSDYAYAANNQAPYGLAMEAVFFNDTPAFASEQSSPMVAACTLTNVTVSVQRWH